MSRTPRLGLGLGLVLVLGMALLLPRPATACVRTRAVPGGPCLYWGLRTVPIYVNQLGSDDLGDGSDIAAAEAGVARWSQPACSDFAFEYRGLTSHTEAGYRVAELDNLNLIVWRETLCRNVVPASDACWSCLDTGEECCGSRYECWEHPRGVIAVTTTTFSRVTGSLVDADIELNGVDYWFTALDTPACQDPEPPPRCALPTDCLTGERCFDGFCLAEGCIRTDIENTVTHEAGHIVGLDHSADPVSTMYASAPEGETLKRTLEEDDRECFCAAYPLGAATVTCFGREILFTPVDQKRDTRGCGCQSPGGGPFPATSRPQGGGAVFFFGLGLVLGGFLLAASRRRGRAGVVVLLLLVGGPGLASAHLLSAPPDLDAWIAKGEVVGLAVAGEAPRPCGAERFPAVQTLQIAEVIAGEMTASGPELQVLLLDEHAHALPLGLLAPVVLARSQTLETCAPLPEWRIVTPGPAGLLVQQQLEWRTYLAGVRGLPDRGAARRAALQALWTRTLRGEDPTLIAHATSRLAGLGDLPRSAVRALVRLAEDQDQDRSVRLRAIRMAGARLEADTFRALLADTDLEIVEAALTLLRGASPEILEALRQDLVALARIPEEPNPREVILGAASLSVLSSVGHLGHRKALAELAAHRLFKAREWSVRGLGALAKRGDGASRRVLVERLEQEPDTRIRALIEAELGDRPPRKAQRKPLSKNLGLRMLFVLVGLLSLAGMLVLPRLRPTRLPPTH